MSGKAGQAPTADYGRRPAGNSNQTAAVVIISVFGGIAGIVLVSSIMPSNP